MKYPAMRHPGRWLWLILLVPIAIGVGRLRFDAEVFDLLPADLSSVEGLKIYQRHFSNARELVVTMESSDADRTAAAAQAIADHLRPLTNLVSSVTWEPPWLEHPEQAAELVAYLWFNQPPAVFGELTNRLAPANAARALDAARQQLATSLSPEDIARLSYDPFGLTRLPSSVAGAAPSFTRGSESFASADGTFRIVFVRSRGELRSYRDCERWLDSIQPAIQSAADSLDSGSGGNLRIGYTGRPVFVTEVASGMQHDMIFSVGGTAAIIGVLFWIAHRRVKPMLWLLTLLALILGGTLALGGLIFGTINVVSIGFAAILLGLAVDYAVVHYQEALAHPGLSIPQIRHAIAPSIFWAAVTTICAFLVLNFGGLPGLGQLGTLVGLGVALSALVMIFEYLPPLFPGRNEPSTDPVTGPAVSEQPQISLPNWRRWSITAATAVVLTLALVVLGASGAPPIDSSANALRPRNSPAYAALDEIQARLSQANGALWLIVGASNEMVVGNLLENAQTILAAAQSNHVVEGFTLPTPVWPRPEFQIANRAVALHLADQREQLRRAALAGGFLESAMAFTDQMLDAWRTAGAATGTFLPTNQLGRWIFDKVAALSATNDYALGLVRPAASATEPQIARLQKELEADSKKAGGRTWLSSWELLGGSIFEKVKANLWKVAGPMIALVFISLWFAFHRSREILLSLGALCLSGLCLLAIMRIAHWSWNLLNLMAIPLILGTGVDYGIFMQLALRRYGGDLRTAYRSVGRALLLCGGTAIAAFASLSWSSNEGMASLGRVCAVGIACNMLIAVFLLPGWWHGAKGANGAAQKSTGLIAKPQSHLR